MTDIPQRLFAFHVYFSQFVLTAAVGVLSIVVGEETEAAGRGGRSGMGICDSLVGVILVGSGRVHHP